MLTKVSKSKEVASELDWTEKDKSIPSNWKHINDFLKEKPCHHCLYQQIQYSRKIKKAKANWRKAEIANWLIENSHAYSNVMLKADLWKIAQEKIKNDPQYRVDTIIKKFGHICMRLPPYHPGFNPIERI